MIAFCNEIGLTSKSKSLTVDCEILTFITICVKSCLCGHDYYILISNLESLCKNIWLLPEKSSLGIGQSHHSGDD